MKRIIAIVGIALLSGCSELAALFDDKGPDAPAIPATGPRLISVKASSPEPYIIFEYAGLENWPKKLDKKKNKYLHGSIRVNGKIVEHFWVGMHRQHLDNIYGREYRVPGIKTGDKVKIGLRSMDGKFEAAPYELGWPFKGT